MSSIDPSVEPSPVVATSPESAQPVERAAMSPPMPTNPAALVEAVARGLAPDADPATRAAAWQIWTTFSPMIGALVQSMPGASPAVAPTATQPAAMPTGRLTPEQLGDALIAQLRARLPPGTELPTQRGFSVQMVKPK